MREPLFTDFEVQHTHIILDSAYNWPWPKTNKDNTFSSMHLAYIYRYNLSFRRLGIDLYFHPIWYNYLWEIKTLDPNFNFKPIVNLVSQLAHIYRYTITIANPNSKHKHPNTTKCLRKEKVKIGQKNSKGPIAPTNLLIRIVAIRYTYKHKWKCIQPLRSCLKPIAPSFLLVNFRFLQPTARPIISNSFFKNL